MPQSNKSKKAKKGKISLSHKDPTAHSKKRRIPHSSVGSKKSVKKLFNKTLSGTKKYDNIDVKTLKDVSKVIQHIKNNVVTLLLIYADWCGHCGTFKKDIWKKLAGMKGRKVAMAQINETMLGEFKKHVPQLKVDGYPTNVLIGQDLTPGSTTDESGESSNAVPNSRDLASMTKLVTADPQEVLEKNGMSRSPSVESHSKSATPTEEASVHRSNRGKEVLENLRNNNAIDEVTSHTVPNPPDIEDDITASSVTESPENNSPENNNRKLPNAVGGSLYAYLLNAASKTVVPAALTTTAMVLTRRKRKHKKTHTRGTKLSNTSYK